MVNKCIVQGNLVRDPEMQTTAKGVAVCNFTIAMSEKYNDSERKLFLNCTAWNKQANLINDRFRKGDNILLVGKLWTHQWDKDGIKRKENQLDVAEVHFTFAMKNDEAGAPSNFGAVDYGDDSDFPF